MRNLFQFGQGKLVVGSLVALLAVGCGGEGAGTVKIDNPEAIRAKASPEGNPVGKAGAAKALETEAGKKNPKLK
jgi:hypothetical protein